MCAGRRTRSTRSGWKLAQPELRPAETARQQIERLGYAASDVRHIAADPLGRGPLRRAAGLPRGAGASHGRRTAGRHDRGTQPPLPPGALGARPAVGDRTSRTAPGARSGRLRRGAAADGGDEPRLADSAARRAQCGACRCRGPWTAEVAAARGGCATSTTGKIAADEPHSHPVLDLDPAERPGGRRATDRQSGAAAGSRGRRRRRGADQGPERPRSVGLPQPRRGLTGTSDVRSDDANSHAGQPVLPCSTRRCALPLPLRQRRGGGSLGDARWRAGSRRGTARGGAARAARGDRLDRSGAGPAAGHLGTRLHPGGYPRTPA